jgi:hypothetical protein
MCYKGRYCNAGLRVATGNCFPYCSLQGTALDTGSDFLEEALDVGRKRLPTSTLTSSPRYDILKTLKISSLKSRAEM